MSSPQECATDCINKYQDLAQSLPAAYRRGLVRLPDVVVKPIHQLTHMDSQKRVDLVEALVSWRLLDELIRCEGIDDGEFTVDYKATFKPSVKLMQVRHFLEFCLPSKLMPCIVGGSARRLALGLVKCPRFSGEQSY